MLENQRNSLPFWEVHLFILIAVDGNGNTMVMVIQILANITLFTLVLVLQ